MSADLHHGFISSWAGEGDHVSPLLHFLVFLFLYFFLFYCTSIVLLLPVLQLIA